MSHLKYENYKGYGDIAARDYHYAQAVRIGDTIEISGQGGWDTTTAVISDPDDVAGQIAQAFVAVETALRAAGGTGWAQVYKVRSYHVGLDPDVVLPIMVENLRKYCPNHQPIWTMLGVEALGRRDMKVEIEVKAHVGAQ